MITISLFISALLVSGGSGDYIENVPAEIGGAGDIDSGSLDSTIGENAEQTQDETSNGDGAETATEVEDTSSPNSSGPRSTRVTFDITTLVYASNALQVRLVWGEIDTTAVWGTDESWTMSTDFPINTVNPLIVTFSDDNGTAILASFETEFKT